MAYDNDPVNQKEELLQLKAEIQAELLALKKERERTKALAEEQDAATPQRATFEDNSLALAYHENPTVILRGEDKVYPLQRHLNGDYSFLRSKPDLPKHRAMLLKKHFPKRYRVSDTTVVQKRLEEKLRLADGQFAPHKPFFLDKSNDGDINLWRAPYWYKVKTGMVSTPLRVISNKECPLFIRKLLCHLFTEEQSRNTVKKWIKNSLYHRNTTALILIAEGRTGKSALLAMIAGLHYPNSHSSYELEAFAGKQFTWGALEHTTFVGVNEGKIEERHLPRLKIFINNLYFDAEAKNIQNKQSKNHNSLIICSDKEDAFMKADQPMLNRCIFPLVQNKILEEGTEVTLEDGTKSKFTHEEILRIYNLSERNDPAKADADTLAISEYLEEWDDGSIDLNSIDVTGYHNKDLGHENYFNGLKDWEKKFLLDYLYLHLKNTPKLCGTYRITHADIRKILDKANKDTDMKFFLQLQSKTAIAMHHLFLLGKINAKVVKSIRMSNKTKEFDYEICANFVDNFLASQIGSSNPKPPPEPEPTPPSMPKNEPIKEIIVVSPSQENPPESPIPETQSLTTDLCYLDFEFHLHCKTPKLICLVATLSTGFTRKWWLWDKDVATIRDLGTQLSIWKEQGFTFVSFTDAEPRCFYSLGLHPLGFKWLDAQILGYPFFHSSASFGQFAGDNYFPDEDDMWFENDADTSDEEVLKQEDKAVRKKAASLLGFYEFFTGKKTDQLDINKEATRKLILSLKSSDTIDNLAKEQILNYCSQDVTVLQELTENQIIKWKQISNKTEGEIIERFKQLTLFRVRMADVSYHGLPLNREVYEDLIKTYDARIRKEQKALGCFYREEPITYYTTNGKSWKKGQIKKLGKFVQDYNLLTFFIQLRRLEETWPKTPSGRYSTEEKVLMQFQIIPEIYEFWQGRKRIKHIEFFKPDEDGSPKIAKFVTEENGILHQHPEFGTFGTLTSRNAHKTKTFIMGMERKLRKELLGTEPGMIVLQPDFSAQEVWVAGALSGDQNQLRAAFEDPYIYFGRQAGLIPEDGDKHSHATEREICKTVVLAAFYGMGFQSLKNKLQLDVKKVTDLQNKNKELYATYFQWRSNFLKRHQREKYYELLDGWTLLDNKKPNGEYKTTTSMNFPIQGHGAVLMRKVVNLFYENRHWLPSEKIRLIYTLHDEFGVLCEEENEDEVKIFMTKIMQDACRHYFPALEPPRVGFK